MSQPGNTITDLLHAAAAPAPFAVVAADPAWLFGDALPGASRGASKNYQCLTVDELCRLELPPIADDAILFLWRVSSMVEEAYRVVRAWGFVPKTELVWRKLTVKGNRHFGMGRTLRAEHETCVVATRGRPTILNRSTRSVFDAAEVGGMFEGKVGSHSEKPAEFFEIVEALAPGPRVELFARQQRPGWTCVGDQVPGAPTTMRVRPA